MTNTLLQNLQEKWSTTKFRDVILSLQPGFACGKRDDGGYIQLRMNNIGLEGRVITDSFLKIPKSETNLKKYLLQNGDVIFNNTNSPELVGKTVLFRGELDNCVYSNHLTRIRVNENLTTPEFVTHFLRLEQRMGTFQLLCRRFVGQAAVPKDSLLDLDFPLPPINEQKRIVSKIEELSKESKSAREALDKMPEIMKRFRQSVLAKAFRGELVPQDPNDEPAEKTLEKLRIEKREKLKKEPIAKGRKNKQIEYEESEPLDIEKLSELPVGWTLSRLGEITNIIGGGTPKREVRSYYDNGKIPWVTPTDIDPKKILPISKTAIYITNRGLRESSARLFPKGTVLFSSRASIGKIAIADTEMSSNQGFANIIPDKILDSEYLAYGLRNFVREIESLGSGTTFLEVAKSSLKQFPFPLAPLGEQKRIVKRIKELFSFADQIEKSVEEAKKRIDKIDQAILAKAFRGELVPQDPNDEPASVLLERITKKKELEKPVKKDKKICKD